MTDNYKKVESVLSVVSVVSEVMSVTNEPQQLLDVVLDTLLDVLEVDCCWFQLITLDDHRLWLAAYRGFSSDMKLELGTMGMGHSVGGQVAGLGDIVVIPDLSHDRGRGLSSFNQAGFYSLAAVPLRTYRIQGVMGIASRAKKGFSKEFVELLTVLAGMVGVALDKADIYHRVLVKTKKLKARGPVDTVPKQEPADLYQDFVAEIRRAARVDWSAVGIIEGSDVHLFIADGTVNDSRDIVVETVPLAATAMPQVIAYGKALEEKDPAKINSLMVDQDGLESSVKSAVYVPLKVAGDVFGAMVIASYSHDAFSQQEISHLENCVQKISLPLRQEILSGKHTVKEEVPPAIATLIRGLFREAPGTASSEVESKLILSYSSDRIQLDFTANEVSVDGRPVALTPAEYRLFYTLVNNEGHVLPEKELEVAVWGDASGERRTLLKMNIEHLKQKLRGEVPLPDIIIKIPGSGYRFYAQ